MSDKFNINSIENLNNNTVYNFFQRMVDTPKDTIKDAKNEMIIKAELLGLTLEEYKIFNRLITLEKLKHSNNSSVVQIAEKLCDLTAEKLKLVQPDWLLKWIDYSSCVSDEMVQQLWAKILSGEVNNPGTFSLQTLNTLSMIDKAIAEKLQLLFQFCIFIDNGLVILYDDLYKQYPPQYEIDYQYLLNIESLGIIKCSTNDFGFGIPIKANTSILMTEVGNFKFKKTQNPNFTSGSLFLTKVGQEIYALNKKEQMNIELKEIIKKYILEKNPDLEFYKDVF